MLVLGIDLGSGFSKVYTMFAGTEQALVDSRGNASFDTAIFKDDDGSWLIGFDARQMMRVFPDRGVRDFKRHLGSDTNVGMGLTAKDAFCILVKELTHQVEERAREKVVGVVVLKPPGFTDEQTADVVGALKDAGLKVLGVLNESTSAVWSVIEGRPFPPGPHRVYCVDVGALTTDFSLVTVNGKDVTVEGAESEFLGGEDLTGVLRGLVADAAADAVGGPVDLDSLTGQTAQQLAVDLETAKIQLSSQSSAVVPVPVGGAVRAIKVQRDAFEAACRTAMAPAVERARAMLGTHGVGAKDLALVVYTGAPMRSQFLRELFDEELGLHGECAPNPSLAGVIGAYLHGVRLAHEAGHSDVGALPATAVHDCTSHPIGIMLVHHENKQRVERCHVLVPAGQPINQTAVGTFKPEIPNQPRIDVVFVQGQDGALLSECTVIGTASLALVPVADTTERVKVEVGFGAKGMTHVTLTDLLSGKSVTVSLDPDEPHDHTTVRMPASWGNGGNP